MRGAIIIFVLGVVAGAIGLNYLKQRNASERSVAAATDTPPSESTSILGQARNAASDARDAVAQKLDDWNLTGEDIKRDLSQGTEVVRRRSKEAGETVATVASKARVVGTIKAKYALDRELKARTIEVDFDQGTVILHGTVPSESLIGKAVALALDTNGVVEVKSLLGVEPGAPR
jgi:hyperosmotically inducible periplasmic protein